MEDLVRLTIDSTAGIATLVMNQPHRRNPTSIAMLDAMDGAIDTCLEDGELRVLILSGAGPSFCSGLDLDEVRGTDEIIHQLLRRLSEVMRRLHRLPMATIAVVQGAAIGGGFGFVVACDLALSHPEARLGYPDPALSLSPALMAPWLMRKIGPVRARAMMLTGGTISGEDACHAGIVNILVDRETLDRTAQNIAGRIAAGSTESTRILKQFLNEQDGSLDDEDLDRAALLSATIIASEDTQERLRIMLD